MGSALYPYLERKEKIDIFILVSDEGENEKYKDLWFSDIFQQYRKKVNNKCKIFLVSFLNVGEQGLIYERLKNNKIFKNNIEGLEKDIKQFRLHPLNPDTSKFSALLGLITLQISELQEPFEILKEYLCHLKHFFNDKKTIDSSVANDISDLIFQFITG